MKLSVKHIVAVLLTISVMVVACKKDPPIVQPGADIFFYIPKGWPQPFYSFTNNTVTPEGFFLGRKLFYDARLSSDNSTSCGTCHQPFSGFAQIDHDLSHGVHDRSGTRNSPGIFNMAWHTSFFWDGGVNNLEVQPINPIENPLEMDLPLADAVKKIDDLPEYKNLFRQAFGTEEVNSQRMLRALTQFMVLLISDNSKYDAVSRGDAGVSYTTDELAGKQLFESNCAQCHKAPLFSDFSFRNNGLAATLLNDSGRATITKLPEDLYKFKVPSLRNLKYTAPYMHDGRLKSIDAVLDHYDHGIVQSSTLDPLLQNGLQFNAAQRSQLKAFLATLNDESVTKDERFLEPRP